MATGKQAHLVSKYVRINNKAGTTQNNKTVTTYNSTQPTQIGLLYTNKFAN